MISRFSLVLVAATLALAGGCGDDSESDAGKAGAAGTAGGAGASAGGGSSGSGGSGGGASGTGGSSGGASGAAGSSGGASGAAGSSGGASGTGGAPPTGSVTCETKTCSLPATICCALYNQPDDCISPGAECFYGVDVACDGPEDCPSGQVCCGTVLQQGKNKAYDTIACAGSCTGTDHREICGSSGSCASGTCGASDLLPQYQDCK